MASVSCLPIEVVHHILGHLSPRELLVVRQLTRTLNHFSTVNHLWQPHTLELIQARPVLFDLRQVPPSAWSFSHSPDGWFRAYLTIMKTSKSGWVPTEDGIRNTCWSVHFTGLDLVDEIPEKPQAICRFDSDGIVYVIDGHLLEPHKWWIENGAVRVPAYPALRPSRGKYTWGRVLTHSGVHMLSTSADFLENLLRLHLEILEASSLIPAQEKESMTEELEWALRNIRASERDTSVMIRRIEELHFVRRRSLRLEFLPNEEPEYPTHIGVFGAGLTESDDEDDMSSDSDFESQDSEFEAPQTGE
ncbi:hypothetical protein BJ508DRAFT_413074 [Ascobolus immersus RN42]|uniref:F-box domain-containing protein n=1 Tax=Ascobolus immersus RN42 TaxID=1160509 RepID=A0A3N4IEP3_ASCIM|nr:hypothetical protein BJ508DRAFT_413074 [Ascobolus immersus RN42]